MFAFVEPDEIRGVEGFDEEPAIEVQNRAREYLAKIEEEFDSQRRALGVEDALKQINGLTTPMLVKLGENDVKTVDDFAGCATDDLVGWTERKDGETTKNAGYLDGFEISREDAEAMIMEARVLAGWIEAQAEPEGEGEGEAVAEEQAQA